jgi:hypothetical protein
MEHVPVGLQSEVLGENCSAAGQSACREEKAKKERTFSGNMSQPVGELNIHRVVEFRQSMPHGRIIAERANQES